MWDGDIYHFVEYDDHIGYVIFLENRNSWRRHLSCLVPRIAKASASSTEASAGGEDVNKIVDASTASSASFFAKAAVVIGIGATATVISLLMKQPSSGPSLCLPQILDAQSDAGAATVGYTFSMFGKKVIIPEYTPGYAKFSYFCFFIYLFHLWYTPRKMLSCLISPCQLPCDADSISI